MPTGGWKLGGRRSGRGAAPSPRRYDPQFVTVREYLEVLRAADQRLADERDRRYAEVAEHRERALRAKERADQRALNLTQAAQQYRDEQANRLREQYVGERGKYITKSDHEALIERIDVAIKPLAEFVAADRVSSARRGGQQGQRQRRRRPLIASLSLLVSVVVAILLIVRG